MALTHAPGDLAKDIDLRQPTNGGTPDARIGILTGEREQRISLLRTQLIDSGGPNAGISVLPARLWTEFLENTHLFVATCKTQARSEVYTANVTSASCIDG